MLSMLFIIQQLQYRTYEIQYDSFEKSYNVVYLKRNIMLMIYIYIKKSNLKKGKNHVHHYIYTYTLPGTFEPCFAKNPKKISYYLTSNSSILFFKWEEHIHVRNANAPPTSSFNLTLA